MSSRDVVALIRQTGKRHGADAAVELLEALCDVEARGRTDVTSAAALTDHAFAAAISLYARERRADAALALHDAMLTRRGVAPSAFTFAGVLSALAEEARPSRRGNAAARTAAREFRRMREECGVRPNRVCHNLLLKCFARAGAVDDADALLCTMRERGMQIDATSLRHCLVAASRSGDATRARQYYDELGALCEQLRGEALCCSDCNALVMALARSGDFDGAVAFARAMPTEAGIAADRITYNALLDALARSQDTTGEDTARARPLG